jgi:LmbE family N-acetylglucosaminyl deacetylase
MAQIPVAPDIPKPDDRYKADVLLIMAHPDDDTEIAPYLARLVFDEHKRVAAIYATRGDAGGNLVGMEQGRALGDVREIEARRALAALGIANVWFLREPDTPGQDVLHSLEAWQHGSTLENVVRLVRLTQPDVILTMLPDYVAGENHGDHQAAAVVAVEGFDSAADPLMFPEQLAAPREQARSGNFVEGLKPWQAKKIYFFDADGYHQFDGKGPQFRTTDLSPAKGVAYSQFRRIAWSYYATQNEFTPRQLDDLSVAPVRLVFGKSLVKSSVAGDVFEGLPCGDLPFSRPSGSAPEAHADLTLELGDPWSFYQKLWAAHDLKTLPSLVEPEAEVNAGESFWVALSIRNGTASGQQVAIRSVIPEGWKMTPADQLYRLGPNQTYPIQLALVAPTYRSPVWRELRWTSEVDGKVVGEARLNIHVVQPNLPSQ